MIHWTRNKPGLNAVASAGRQTPYLQQLIRHHLPADRGAAILDLGCGSGTLLTHLKLAGYTNLRGVDVSKAKVDAARAAGLPEAELGDLTDYLADVVEPFDTILLMDVLEHLPIQGQPQTLAAIHKRLSNGGRLLIHVPNGEGVFGMGVRYGDSTHETAFTRGSLTELLKQAGFQDIRCYEERPVVHGMTSLARHTFYRLLTLPTRLLYLAETGNARVILSRNLLCVARK